VLEQETSSVLDLLGWESVVMDGTSQRGCFSLKEVGVGGVLFLVRRFGFESLMP
jgi:hypothetical protein